MKELTFSKKNMTKIRVKKPSVKKLDDLFRKYIRLRDNMTCQRCAKQKGKLEVAHFYSRAIKSTRWEPDNVQLLCFSCHYLFAHQNPLEFAEYWSKMLGPERMSALRILRSLTKPVDRSLIELWLKSEIKQLEIQRDIGGISEFQRRAK